MTVTQTVAELEAQLLALLPPRYANMRDVLVAIPGALRRAELAADSLAEGATVGGATGIWLTMMGHGYGVDRSTSEPDASLRTRIRSPEGSTTRPALLDAVNKLLSPYTDVEATMIEWWDEPYLDLDSVRGCWLDISYISAGRNTFLLFVPLIGHYAALDSFLDCAPGGWLNVDLFLGDDGENPIYAAIVAEVEKKRAAGVQWALVIGDPPIGF